ncbi:MAG: DUF3096 domain-containing protein [Acidimicrobiia bacterium]|nr:DUF3096 domain-containing protein [Acidimicrobiia bacterium]
MLTLAQTASIDIDFTLPAVLAILFGVLVLFFPKVLNYLVGAYLILFGIVLLFDITL